MSYSPVDQSAAASSGAVPKVTKKAVKKLIKKAISDRDQQCELMDAASEQKRFPETDQVLAYDDFNLQTIFEYIQITRFEIDQFMLDKFWQSLTEGGCVFMNTTVLEWLGYDHEEERYRKAAFLKLLKSNEIDFKQIKHNDPDFDQYPDFVAEAAQLSADALRRQQWIILDAQDFKRVVFSLRTKRSREIVNYYLSLERLMAMYTEYTHHFQIIRERRRADLEKKSLLAMMEGLKLDHQKDREERNRKHEEARQEDKRRYEEDQRRYEAECAAAQNERDAAERGRQVAEQKFNQLMARGDELLKHAEQAEDDRMVMMHDIAAVRHVAAPEPPKSENFHRMAIVKMSPNYEWDEQTDKRYLRHVDAIAVRIQVRDFNARIREIQNYGNGTNKDAEIIISFDSPNPVRLYNKLKPTYSNQFTFVPPVGIRFEPGTEEDLVAAVRDMHEARMQYPHNE